MTRRYGQPIQAQVVHGQLYSFKWRGTLYRIHRVLATWHLRDRWWATISGKEAETSSNRTYYRLDCSGDLQCDVYFDASTNVWILDRIYD
jgi:hypothetical protein